MSNCALVISCKFKIHGNSLNPPPGPYHIERAYCNNATNDIDARESGIILRFVIEHYRRIYQRNVFFIHNHDTGWHVGFTDIWSRIANVVASPTFWTRDFGSLGIGLTNRFPPHEPDGTWLRNVEVIPWLFQGTSLTEWIGKRWEMPCCSTFWLNSELLWQRSKPDYVRLLANINKLGRTGFCEVFNWTICNDPDFVKNLKQIETAKQNYRLGQTMEIVWGVVLANRSRVN
jgi:hypothetical protein